MWWWLDVELEVDVWLGCCSMSCRWPSKSETCLCSSRFEPVPGCAGGGGGLTAGGTKARRVCSLWSYTRWCSSTLLCRACDLAKAAARRVSTLCSSTSSVCFMAWRSAACEVVASSSTSSGATRERLSACRLCICWPSSASTLTPPPPLALTLVLTLPLPLILPRTGLLLTLVEPVTKSPSALALPSAWPSRSAAPIGSKKSPADPGLALALPLVVWWK